MPQPASQPTEVVNRHAARVILVNAEDRLLLFRCQEPGSDRAFWITPGGGLEGSETHEQAALRELREETGLDGITLGPWVWKRTHTFPWLNRIYRQHERFFLVRCDGHRVCQAQQTAEELEVLTEHRWWSAGEIQQATDQTFAPSRVGLLLRDLLRDAMPQHPLDVGA